MPSNPYCINETLVPVFFINKMFLFLHIVLRASSDLLLKKLLSLSFPVRYLVPIILS